MTFDWHKTIAKRPIFAADYWPGVPAVDHEGRPDIAHDLEHIKAYCDPVLVRSLSLRLKSTDVMPEEAHRGWFNAPDLMDITPEQMQQWRQRVTEALKPLAKQYRDAGMHVIELGALFNCSGWDYAPDWYKKDVPDWQECDLAGKPLSETGKHPMSCLVHPKMYEVSDMFYEALRVFDDSALLGSCIDNESHLAHHDLSDFGGHPLTVKAFTEFIADSFQDITAFNQLTENNHTSFDQIHIRDDHWLVRALATRFRGSLIAKYYQSGLGRSAKKSSPNHVTITRLAVGVFFREQWEGRESLGLDLTYLDPAAIDVMGWSHSVDPGKNFDLLGGMAVTGDLLRQSGIAIGITEPHVQRYGPHYSPYRPDELLHLIYRGLFYNFRFFNLHSWERTGDWQIWNEPVAAVYRQRRGILKQVRELRSELDYIRPFETFGQPILPPLRILVSRNARGYPAMEGRMYGNLLADLCPITEHAKASCYSVVEEQTHDLDIALANARGIIVSDACLTSQTRTKLDFFVAAGGKLLVIGAPAYVDENYAPAQMPSCYPVAALEPVDLGELEKRDITAKPYSPVPFPAMCPVTAAHPVWPNVSPLVLAHPTTITLKDNAVAIAHTHDGQCIAAANDSVVYIAGPLEERDQLAQLLDYFAQWCDVQPPSILISQFENASVAQNYDSTNQDHTGQLLDQTSWHGNVALNDHRPSQIRELREDHPWLAYHQQDNQTILEGVALDPLAIKVFRWQDGAKEMTHFTGLPSSLGIQYFWTGEIHPIIARFSVLETTQVTNAKIIPHGYDSADLSWYVTPVGSSSRIAQGPGCENINFEVVPGRDYYLVAVTNRHSNLPVCPLCTQGQFE
jgi:hypothetical protein